MVKIRYLLSAPLTSQQKELYDAVLNKNIREYLLEKKKDNHNNIGAGSGALTPLSELTVTSAAPTPMSVSVSSLNSSSNEDYLSATSSTNGSSKREREHADDDDLTNSSGRRSTRRRLRKKRKSYQEISDDDEYFNSVRNKNDGDSTSNSIENETADDDVLTIAEEYQDKLARK